MAIPILVADTAGNYVGANFEAYALTGFSRRELLQRSVADLTPPADRSDEERLWNAFVRADGQSGIYALRRKDGTTLRVRYDAYTNIADGFHISFLTAAPAPASYRMAVGATVDPVAPTSFSGCTTSANS